MKKTIAIAAVVTAMFHAVNVNAADHTFSVGYAQTDIEGVNKNLTGLALKYRYEPGRLGLLVGLIGTTLNESTTATIVNNQVQINTFDRTYGSIHIGPTYRFNDMVSGYATLGYATYEAKRKSGDSVTSGFEDSNFAAGAGIELNLTQSLALNGGVEYSEHLINSTALTYTVGLGFRF
ncbi:Ail/Lom family outer membrane beta-barrel protein [Vibrio cholerae]|uniref:Ail/Lom family outer membrane beta-barrel protein n=1 Tax=Vibrio cholerae TaxID=666 RepID=UPI001156F7CE|nr:Ail/Lom family outer membrane beta-barrel protein [Vibrio cholerae]TQQ77274.1 outer membrane beta-barrel protein [Vibrio cholerae]